MWLSSFKQRIMQYYRAEKKYVVNVEITCYNKMDIVDVPVKARGTNDARKKALDIVHETTKLRAVGSKVVEKQKQFSQWL